MRRVHVVAATIMVLVLSSGVGSALPQSSRSTRASVSAEVKRAAKRLAFAWVDTAGQHTLDGLANRSIAFAGMVPGLYVVLDGKRMSATQALMDSALTIIKSNDNHADAAAIRNTVYTLMEIAEGRVMRGR